MIPLIEINIENKILLVSGRKVILDNDLAEIYGITLRNLNKAVELNRERFPKDSIFQILKYEYDTLAFYNTTIQKIQPRKTLPYAFTQESIAKMPDILNSKRAIEANVQILGTFNWLRTSLLTNKNEYYQDAFKLACNIKGDLNKWDTKIFLDVMQLIGKKIVDQIENFVASNKGILLIGGDYDLLSGIVGYIWYTHPLQRTASTNKCVNDEWERWKLSHKDFCGFNNEEEIRVSLFSTPEGLMNRCKYGKILFLRDLNTKYIEILERIGRIIRNFRLFYREGSESLWNEYLPSIVIMNTKKIDGLTEEFLQQFEIINLVPNRESKPSKTVIVPSKNGMKKREGPLKTSVESVNVRNETDDKQHDRNLDQPNVEETIKLTLCINECIVYWNGNRLQSIKDKDFAILLALAKRTGELVKNYNLYEFIDSKCNESVLLNQRISTIRKAFPAPYNDLNHPQCIIPDAKRKKGYRRLNLTKDQVQII